MENTGMEGRRGRLVGSVAQWTRAEWRSLLVALAISLAAHLLLLAAKGPRREGDGRAPVLVARLVDVRVTPPGPAIPLQAPPAPPPAAPQRPARERAQAQAPRPLPRPIDPIPDGPRMRPPKPGPAEPAPPPPPAPPAEIPPAPEQLANPLSRPELGEVARRVIGRRLQTTIWIDEEGKVQKAFVKRNELSEEDAATLEKALAGVRFAPARQQGSAVPSVLDTRLCFDDGGVLDTSSPECLRPEPPAEAPPPSR